MSITTNPSLFIFRRDLRLEDNTALLDLLRISRTVMPCFIFDPQQVERRKNPYFSAHAFVFMLTSLQELDEVLRRRGSRLYVFTGEAPAVMECLIRDISPAAVAVNRDYTPFSLHRDEAIRTICEAHGVPFLSRDDTLVHPPQKVCKPDGGVYTVFTPYFRRWQTHDRVAPVRNNFQNFYDKAVPGAICDWPRRFAEEKYGRQVSGGRSAARAILRRLRDFVPYDRQRDTPARDATTHLSAHLKFGTVSAREVAAAVTSALGAGHSLMRQLAWRDFFTQIGYHYPEVLGRPFREKYDDITWCNDPARFAAWCRGRTGFPIVDAGMRELNASGYMHNRVRMITASFLVKDLHIDWQEGERYFAQRLVDYDPLVNNGNWQWAASTGCDAQPYFRIFNPWRQQEKFDPDTVYIKRWIPELRDLSAAKIHRGHQRSVAVNGYPAPVVDHMTQSRQARIFYRQPRR